MKVCVMFIVCNYEEKNKINNYCYRGHHVFYDLINVNGDDLLSTTVRGYIQGYNNASKNSKIIEWHVKEIDKKVNLNKNNFWKGVMIIESVKNTDLLMFIVTLNNKVTRKNMKLSSIIKYIEDNEKLLEHSLSNSNKELLLPQSEYLISIYLQIKGDF